MSNTPNIEGITISAKGEDAEIMIYNTIGDSFFSESLTAKAFADQLNGLKNVKRLNVRMNSPGGSVFDANAIYNTLKSHKAEVTVTIEGASLSAASIVAMAGDKIRMAKNGFMMIHDPYTYTKGNAKDMRGTAKMLDKIKSAMIETYTERTKQEASLIDNMMTDETWMTATEAKALGFIDEIIDQPAVAANFDADRFGKVPEEFRLLLASANQPVPFLQELPPMADQPKAATVAEIKAACDGCEASFVVAQIEANATVEQVNAAWSKQLADQLKAVKAELEAAKQAKPEPIVAKQGLAPIPAGKQVETDPVAEWKTALAAKVTLYNGDRVKAVQALNRENPELRLAYVAATNSR
jgi:ATP-dependent Clp protease, protease subunit